MGLLVAGYFGNLLSSFPIWPVHWDLVAKALGWAFIGLGTGGCAWAFRYFRRASTPIVLTRPVRDLICAGPYRYSRNPMYCFLFVISVGITINWNTVWPLLGFPILWLVLDRWVVRREERHLEATFGDQYRDYCRRVRRWM